MANPFKFPDLGEIPESLVRRAMPDIVRAVEEEARRQAPRRSGQLREKIHGVVLPGGLTGAVQATSRHAHLVHDGTAAHAITAAPKGHLSIPSGGHLYVRQSADHPGAKANPFLDRAADESQSEVEGLLKAAADAELEGLV